MGRVWTEPQTVEQYPGAGQEQAAEEQGAKTRQGLPVRAWPLVEGDNQPTGPRAGGAKGAPPSAPALSAAPTSQRTNRLTGRGGSLSLVRRVRKSRRANPARRPLCCFPLEWSCQDVGRRNWKGRKYTDISYFRYRGFGGLQKGDLRRRTPDSGALRVFLGHRCYQHLRAMSRGWEIPSTGESCRFCLLLPWEPLHSPSAPSAFSHRCFLSFS